MTTIRGGMAWGIGSAFAYAAANVCLRAATSVDAAWVSAVKSAWLLLLLGPWLIWVLRRQPLGPFGRREWANLIGAGLIGQFGGNLAFQWALEIIGLSVTVPLCLGTMIFSSALMQRLGEGVPLRRNVWLAMPIFLAAIVLLSIARASTAGPAVIVDRHWLIGALGCGAAGVSGVAYSVLGFSIRRCSKLAVPTVFPMVIVGIVGVVGLGIVGSVRLGSDGLAAISGADWGMMSVAGVANAAGFLALGLSLKTLPVLYVHLVNTSQVAMAALAGALLFAEPVGGYAIAGIVLTILGFCGMSWDPTRREADKASGLAARSDRSQGDEDEIGGPAEVLPPRAPDRN